MHPRFSACGEPPSTYPTFSAASSAVPSDVANDAALAAEGRQGGSREAFLKHTLDNVDRLGPLLNRCADV